MEPAKEEQEQELLLLMVRESHWEWTIRECWDCYHYRHEETTWRGDCHRVRLQCFRLWLHEGTCWRPKKVASREGKGRGKRGAEDRWSGLMPIRR